MAVMFERAGKVLISREQIQNRVREIGRQLSEDLEHDLLHDGLDELEHPDRVVMLPVLTGAVVFVADLIRQMPVKMSIRLVSVSSYPGATTKSKGAQLRGALPKDLEGRHVVVVDDILDSGGTFKLLREVLEEQKPASIRFCALLEKMDVEKVPGASADYVGFQIPNEFVVGYGLDYNGFFRNLPEIVVLADEHR